jgi:hypothetical protein
MKKPRVGDVARAHLQAKGLTAVGYGDVALLHEIAALAGLPAAAWRTERRVLAALERCPDIFEKSYRKAGRGWGRMFTLRPTPPATSL